MSQRSLFSYRVVDNDGSSLQNAKVFVYEIGTTTPIADLYTAMTGGSPVGFLISGSNGKVTGWVDVSRYFTLSVTSNGGAAYYPGVPAVPVPFTTFADVAGAYLVSDVY